MIVHKDRHLYLIPTKCSCWRQALSDGSTGMGFWGWDRPTCATSHA